MGYAGYPPNFNALPTRRVCMRLILLEVPKNPGTRGPGWQHWHACGETHHREGVCSLSSPAVCRPAVGAGTRGDPPLELLHHSLPSWPDTGPICPGSARGLLEGAVLFCFLLCETLPFQRPPRERNPALLDALSTSPKSLA